MSVSWCLWIGWRVDASCADRWGRRDPTEEWVGPRWTLRAGPLEFCSWECVTGGSPVCLCRLSALPVHGPSAQGAWSNSLCGLAGPGRGPRETRGPSPGVSRALGSESLGPAEAWAPQGGAWGRPSTRPPLSLSMPSQVVQPDLEEAGGLQGAGEGAHLRGDCRQDAGEGSLWRRPGALWVCLLPGDQMGPRRADPRPPRTVKGRPHGSQDGRRARALTEASEAGPDPCSLPEPLPLSPPSPPQAGLTTLPGPDALFPSGLGGSPSAFEQVSCLEGPRPQSSAAPVPGRVGGGVLLAAWGPGAQGAGSRPLSGGSRPFAHPAAGAVLGPPLRPVPPQHGSWVPMGSSLKGARPRCSLSSEDPGGSASQGGVWPHTPPRPAPGCWRPRLQPA